MKTKIRWKKVVIGYATGTVLGAGVLVLFGLPWWWALLPLAEAIALGLVILLGVIVGVILYRRECKKHSSPLRF